MESKTGSGAAKRSEKRKTLAEVQEEMKQKFGNALQLDREKFSEDGNVAELYREMLGQVIRFVLVYLGAKFGWVLAGIYRADEERIVEIFSSQKIFNLKLPFFTQFRLALFKDEPILVIHGDSESRHMPVRCVIPIMEMIPVTPSEVKPCRELQFVGGEFLLSGFGMDPLDLLRLKREYARATGWGCVITPLEKRLMEIHQQDKEEDRKEERAAKEEDRLRKKAEREKRLNALMARDTVTCYDSKSGRPLYGVPVSPAEYNNHDHYILPNGKGVVVVDVDSTPLKFFQLVKSPGGKVTEENVNESLFSERPKAVEEVRADNSGSVLVRKGRGDSWEHAFILTPEQRDAFRRAGMNGGAKFILAGEYNKNQEKAQVYEFRGKEIHTVGQHAVCAV